MVASLFFFQLDESSDSQQGSDFDGSDYSTDDEDDDYDINIIMVQNYDDNDVVDERNDDDDDERNDDDDDQKDYDGTD